MSEEKKITQEDLNKARETKKKKIQANVVTGDIVEADNSDSSDKKAE